MCCDVIDKRCCRCRAMTTWAHADCLLMPHVLEQVLGDPTCASSAGISFHFKFIKLHEPSLVGRNMHRVRLPGFGCLHSLATHRTVCSHLTRVRDWHKKDALGKALILSYRNSYEAEVAVTPSGDV